MCGIAGILKTNTSGIAADSLVQVCERMISKLEHRGPDDNGTWIDQTKTIVLGQARLAVLDTSFRGHQPMISHSGRYVITYNGEVYNYISIQKSLNIPEKEYYSETDTEVLLAGFEKWGIEETIMRTNGMFALAVWDRQARRLFLARDRIGIKPLFVANIGGDIVFSSDTRVFREHPEFSGRLSSISVIGYFSKRYVPPERSIYENVFPVIPGTILQIDLDGTSKAKAYWSISEVASDGLNNPMKSDDLEKLDELIHDSVRLRMRSDVPYGAFLSGGIDSSLIVAEMCKISSKPIKTFSIGFTEKAYDETNYARAIAEYLNTDHTEYIFSKTEAICMIMQAIRAYDEPFADSSQLPTLLVSQLARKDVTVILSGDGGDELFGGYKRYFSYPKRWANINRRNWLQRRMFNALLNTIIETGYSVKSIFRKLPVIAFTLQRYLDTANYLSYGLTENSFSEFFYNRQHHLTPLHKLLTPNILNYPKSHNPIPLSSLFSQEQASMLFQDFTDYLPGDILTKVDRATMAVSLEARVPLLDHRIVEYAWHYPLSDRVCDVQPKKALKNLLLKHLPAELFERPKKGFAVPICNWLRSDLKNWGEGLIFDCEDSYSEYIHPKMVQSLWIEHQSEYFDRSSLLWDILIFISWIYNN